MVDLLEAEKVEKAIAVGHDWYALTLALVDENDKDICNRGSYIVSRLANLKANRFIAFAFFALGYFPPQPNFDFTALATKAKERLGYSPYGYWMTFSAEGADKLIEAHVRFANQDRCHIP